MLIKIFSFIFFSWAVNGADIMFNPNFNGTPTWIPAGAPVVPLCEYPGDPSCMGQWSGQALPLAVYPTDSAIPQFQYFLPAFLPTSAETEEIEDDDWEPWTPPRRYRRGRASSRRAEGKVSPTTPPTPPRAKPAKTRGRLDIGQSSPPAPAEDLSASDTSSSRNRAIFVSRTDPGRMQIVDTDSSGKQTVQTGSVHLVSEENITPVNGGFETAQDGYAVPATREEPKKGGEEEECLSLEGIEDTEAGFCAECTKDSSALSLLVKEGFLSKIKTKLKEVRQKVIGKIKNTILISQICSPKTSLKLIIQNFNRTCPGEFKDFFKKAYCESCKKGVPPEIMMAMMSIESAGNCPATASNEREESAGLFQVNSRVHQCRNLKGHAHEMGTASNLKCLKNPINNLNSAVKILVSDSYNKVNPQPLKTGQCPSWQSLPEDEKDGWRRGVSAYNSGAMWVVRAIQAVRDRRTLEDTRYLVKSSDRWKYKKDKASWEELREFYFVEKFSPGNKRSRSGKTTGRQLKWTVSNLAHTEAVLGRSGEVSGLSMVNLWDQYTNKFLRENKNPCPRWPR